MKKILVTDGNGQLGSAFVELYGKQYDICVPDENELDWMQYEAVAEFFARNKFDAVVHSAVCPARHTGLWLEADNLIVFKNLQYACARYGVKKLLVAGDPSDLDTGEGLVNVREDAWQDGFAASGYGNGRRMITNLASKDKITTVLRFFGVYGKGGNVAQDELTEILSHALVGKKQIRLESNKTFSAIYVEDACKIIAQFLEKDLPKGDYNVAAPTPVTRYDFAKKAKAYAKKNEREVELVLGKAEEKECTADVEKLLSVLGTFKFTALTTGINKTLDYYAKHKSQLKAQTS